MSRSQNDKLNEQHFLIRLLVQNLIIIIILFARETVQIIKVQQSKTWHDNQAGRLR